MPVAKPFAKLKPKAMTMLEPAETLRKSQMSDTPEAVSEPIADSAVVMPTGGTGSAVAVASALPFAAGLDPEGLRAFRIALAAEARRFKRYPARAVEAGWIGTTELKISLVPGQPAPLVLVNKSSGYRLLDNTALEMVRKALFTTPVPASLREQAFSVELPVSFSIDLNDG
jgi:protein TonB